MQLHHGLHSRSRAQTVLFLPLTIGVMFVVSCGSSDDGISEGTTTTHAAVNLYLDPDWTGTQSGTQAQPFRNFSANWSTINAALASGDVTIYMSAREAGSDTDDILAEDVYLTSKTANPAGTLTIDGKSFYNTNDSAPSWTAYSGSSKAQVRGFQTQNAAHRKYSKVTLTGLHIKQSTASFGLTICGDNWTVQNSEIEHSAAGISPMVLIVPTADAAHEGASEYCAAMSNVVLKNNTMHDSKGELIYVGGAGCSVFDDNNLSNANCNGKPSHSNITISGNTLYGCGSFGEQGDCIDVKPAITNLTISQNNISNTRADNNNRAMVLAGIQTDGTNQNIVIERNYIHDLGGVEDAAIAIVDGWGTPNGVTIRNNIIDTVNSGDGIRVYRTQSPGVKVFNNTIYNASGYCISSESGSTLEVRNNACLSNNGGGNQTALSGNITSTNNAYSGSWGGTCTNCVPGLTTSVFKSAAQGDFAPVSGSILPDAATPITAFSNDYVGISRPQGAGWDIGAYELNQNSAGNPVPPVAPTNLTVR